MDNIVVAFAKEEARRRVRRMLESGGFRPYACCASGGEAIRALRTAGTGVAVCGFRLGDMTASDLASALPEGCAVLVISSAANLDLCEGEDLYKLASPAARPDFFALLELILRRIPRRPPPQRDGEAETLIRRAKEVLMDVHRMSEAEAHRFLQKQSMDNGWRLADTARRVLDTYTR